MKHVFFSDIDGTIYDFSQEIKPEIINDCNWAKNHNVEFVIATGNGYFNSAKRLAKALNLKYLVLSNGSHIYDFENQKTLYENSIPKVVAQEVIDNASLLGVSIVWWDASKLYFGLHTKKTVISRINEFIHQKEINILEKIMIEPLKIELIDSPEKIDLILNTLKHLPLHIVRMQPSHVEIVNKDVNKFHGIKKFCELFNINEEFVGAVGDSYNDIEMLQMVKHSYVMANCSPDVQEFAQYQTDSVHNNGAGKALSDFVKKVVS